MKSLVVPLCQGVPSVDSEIRPGDIPGCIAEQESHSAHQILRGAHLARRDERDPFVSQFGILVQNLTGPEDNQYPPCQATAGVDTYSAVSMYPGLMVLTRML